MAPAQHLTFLGILIFGNAMLKELNRESKENRAFYNKAIKLMGDLSGNVLDIGPPNIFRGYLQNFFNIKIDGTVGDLDLGLFFDKATNRLYDHVVASRILEHIFNPFFLLTDIKHHMKDSGSLHVFLPARRFWIFHLSTDHPTSFSEGKLEEGK